jgi:cellulose synthase/poly-beta-1,6-N-acetylglucosamine synthase-like glycosyltransferase
MKLSVVLICRNEAHNVAACLQSVRHLANEIIVVDAESTDDTVAVCREFTNRIWFGPGPDLGHSGTSLCNRPKANGFWYWMPMKWCQVVSPPKLAPL